jgi:cyclin B
MFINNIPIETKRCSYIPKATKITELHIKNIINNCNKNLSKNQSLYMQREFGRDISVHNLTSIDNNFEKKKSDKIIFQSNLIKYNLKEFNKENYQINNQNVDSKMLIENFKTNVVNISIESNSIIQDNLKKKYSNPQEVEEYFDDIYSELKSTEEEFIVESNYMSKQNDINHRMRAILIDWLIDVHLKYKLNPETMYITVNLIDRYLEKKIIKRTRLQLVGVTAIFIACKYEEIYPPELKDFVYITDKAYVKQDVIEMEVDMLKTLEYKITFPTQWRFLEIYKVKFKMDEKELCLAWFLMELNLINYKILKFKMSLIVASSIFISQKLLGKYDLNKFFEFTGYNEEDIKPCVTEIYEFNQYNEKHNNLQAIRKKFSLNKYNEVSKIKVK